MSIKDLTKAIPAARKSLSSKLRTFFAVPAAADEEPRRVALSSEMQSEMRDMALTALQRADDLEHVEV